MTLDPPDHRLQTFNLYGVALTLFLEHAVGLLNLGFLFKPKSPAVQDLGHSVFDFLGSPRTKVLHEEGEAVTDRNICSQQNTHVITSFNYWHF